MMRGEKVRRHAHSMGPVTRIRRRRENAEKEEISKHKPTEKDREREQTKPGTIGRGTSVQGAHMK